MIETVLADLARELNSIHSRVPFTEILTRIIELEKINELHQITTSPVFKVVNGPPRP